MHNRPFLLSAKSYSKIFRPHMPPKIASRRESRGQIFPARKQNRLPRHPEPCEGSLWKYRQNLNRDPSKAREDLPCLQRVKRARRNRRRMGVCPWQLVAESASFSAADYRAQASGEIFGKLPQELFTVCLATPDCIQPSRGGAKTRSTRRRSFSAARSG